VRRQGVLAVAACSPGSAALVLVMVALFDAAIAHGRRPGPTTSTGQVAETAEIANQQR